MYTYNQSGDLWPNGNVDALTNTSTPAATVFTGGYMNKPITDMRLAGDRSSASFWYMKALRGDVNLDGEVNIADVNDLVDAILSGKWDINLHDVNGDNEISVADVNALIELILNPNS